jgi:hypothetical protein
MGTAVIFLTGVFVPSIVDAKISQVFPLMGIALAIFAVAFVVVLFTNIPENAPAAAAKGEYNAAVNGLDGYNAAIAQVQQGNLAAAKKSIEGDQSAKADYLRAVIAAKEGNVSAAKAALQSAVAKDGSLAKKAAKDVNLAALR